MEPIWSKILRDNYIPQSRDWYMLMDECTFAPKPKVVEHANGLRVTGVADIELSHSQATALREHFARKNDEGLGRERVDGYPHHAVYPRDDENGVRKVVVLDERDAVSWIMYEGHARYVSGNRREASEVAKAWFEANPVPKPWEDAEPGEVWKVTIGSYGERTVLVTDDQHFVFKDGQVSVNSNSITSGERLPIE